VVVFNNDDDDSCCPTSDIPGEMEDELIEVGLESSDDAVEFCGGDREETLVGEEGWLIADDCCCCTEQGISCSGIPMLLFICDELLVLLSPEA
jgi:hypothetical protein